MNIRTFQKNVARYGAGVLLMRAATIVLLPLYANILTPDAFGVYSLAAAFFAFVTVLSQCGLQQALTKDVLTGTTGHSTKEVFSSTLHFVLLTSTLLAVAAVISARPLALTVLGAPGYAHLMLIGAFGLIAENCYMFGIRMLKIHEKAGAVLSASAVVAVLKITLTVWFLVGMHMGIAGIMLADVIGLALAFAGLLPWLRKYYLPRLDRAIVSRALRFGLPMVAGGILTIGVDVADRFFIKSFLGTRQVGIYSMVYRLGLIMNIFVMGFRSAWTPRILRMHGAAEGPAFAGRTLTQLLAAMAVIGVTVSLCARDILQSPLFDDVYLEGAHIVPLILAGYACNALLSFYSAFPYIQGKSRYFLIADLVAFTVNIALNILLIPYAGLLGAGLATLAAFAAGVLYLWYLSRHRFRVRYECRRIAGIAAAAAAGMAAGMWIDRLFVDVIIIAGLCLMLLLALRGSRLRS
jgi:O-antigen/teichoic acid export membrane protein